MLVPVGNRFIMFSFAKPHGNMSTS